ncbi:MAG: hypothetical protein WBH47_05440 [Streptosporangiaceae bacterium]
MRIDASGIYPESDVRQVVKAPLDDLLTLVNRPAFGCGFDPAGERRRLGVI